MQSLNGGQSQFAVSLNSFISRRMLRTIREQVRVHMLTAPTFKYRPCDLMAEASETTRAINQTATTTQQRYSRPILKHFKSRSSSDSPLDKQCREGFNCRNYRVSNRTLDLLMRSESNSGDIAMGKFGHYILPNTPRAAGNSHYVVHAHPRPELVFDDDQFSYGGPWGGRFGGKVNGRGAHHGG
jgi:hypothetical protein